MMQSYGFPFIDRTKTNDLLKAGNTAIISSRCPIFCFIKPVVPDAAINQTGCCAQFDQGD